MRAAVVTAFDKPPAYREIPAPTPQTPDEILVDVIAAGLHPRVRSQADGSHYTSTGDLPLVPGIDGVGRGADGKLRYFVLPDTTMGAMAERTVVDRRRSITLPDGADPVLVAAATNPVMSSWIALRRRIEFQPGQTVLVLGATGSSGRIAVQVAKHLGAKRVIGAGRNAERLAALTELGADDTVQLSTATAASDLARAAGDVDVVIDYLWGPPTVDAMVAVVSNRSDAGKPLAWIEIGSVAGGTAAIPLRGAARRAVTDRRQRSGLRPNSRHHDRVALAGRRNRQRGFRYRLPRRAARRRGSRVERYRRYPTDRHHALAHQASG